MNIKLTSGLLFLLLLLVSCKSEEKNCDRYVLIKEPYEDIVWEIDKPTGIREIESWIEINKKELSIPRTELGNVLPSLFIELIENGSSKYDIPVYPLKTRGQLDGTGMEILITEKQLIKLEKIIDTWGYKNEKKSAELAKANKHKDILERANIERESKMKVPDQS